MTIVYTHRSWNYQLGCSACAAGCVHYAARAASTRLAHLPDYMGLATGLERLEEELAWEEEAKG